MNMPVRDLCLWVVYVLVIASCAPAPVVPVVDERPPSYAERIEERAREAVDREIHELRYNPGLCGCPPFEVELQGRWHRVTFDVTDDSHPVLVELREAVERDEASGTLGRYIIQGRLDDRVASCGQGALFLTLDPSAYGAPEPDPPEEEELEEPSSPAEGESSSSRFESGGSSDCLAALSSSWETTRSGAMRPSSR